MPFTPSEIDYMEQQTIGRIATSQPDGSLQVSPVGFRYNTELGTIDIGGYEMASSRKYRNVADNGQVAFVVDDIQSTDPWRVRCLEIRGTAEAVAPDSPDGPIIRIRPRRIISFGLEEDLDVQRLTTNSRDVA